MGGTFDPIHFGHLVLAESLREDLCLDRVIFVPTGVSYHKAERIISSGEIRYRMLIEAIDDNPYFYASRIEIERGTYSYTYDTMSELKSHYGTDTLYFMSGADIVFGLESWKNSEWLFKNVNFVIATRSGYDDSKVKEKVKELSQKRGAKIILKEIPLMDISSSSIRERRASGRSIRYLSPGSVCEIIEEEGLYLSSELEK